MRIVPVADAKARLSAHLRACQEGPVVITRNGKPAAVLLAVKDEDELERLILAYSPKFRAILDAARQQIRETGGIQHEDFWQEVEAEQIGSAEETETEEEILSSEEKWDELLTKPKAKHVMRAMAREAHEDYRAGRTTDIAITKDGRLASA